MIRKLLLIACLALAFVVTESEGRATIVDDRCPPIHIHYLVRHEYDCTKFYYCEYGLRWDTPTSCAPGTEFSYSQQVCVHPWDSDCDLTGVPPGPCDPTTTTPGPCDPTTTTTTTPNPCDPTTTTPGPCDPTTTTTTTLAPCDPTTTTPGPCDPTTTTTTTLAPCDPTTTTPGPCDPTTTTTTTPDPCDPTTTTPGPCDPPTTPTTTTTETPCPPVDKCEEECNVLPWADTDCDKYWRCEGTESVLVQCSLGLHFNPEKGSCDYICNAGCLEDPRMCG